MAKPLTEEQRRALADRIRAAEARTTGEIYCVVARTSDDYFYPAAFVLSLGMLAASLPVGVWLDRDWLTFPHLGFVAAQVAGIAAALAVVRFVPGLRIRLVPRRLRYRRAHDNALKQFLAHNVHSTRERTGVLIFVSLAEHYAEIVADAGINARVTQQDWDETIARLVAAAAQDRLFEGLADAIDRSGALLAGHFPGGIDNPNEIEDHVVEL